MNRVLLHQKKVFMAVMEEEEAMEAEEEEEAMEVEAIAAMDQEVVVDGAGGGLYGMILNT
jgi:hypothetical protein